jgi:hypothetical protein
VLEQIIHMQTNVMREVPTRLEKEKVCVCVSIYLSVCVYVSVLIHVTAERFRPTRLAT